MLNKIYEITKGWKTKIGGTVLALPVLLQQFSIDVPDEWDKWISRAGLAVLLLGWADYGARKAIIDKIKQ